MASRIWLEDWRKASVCGNIESAPLLVFLGLADSIIPGTGAILLSSFLFFPVSIQIFQAVAAVLLVGKLSIQFSNFTLPQKETSK